MWGWISYITKQKSPCILYEANRSSLNTYRVSYTYMAIYMQTHTHTYTHTHKFTIQRWGTFSRLLAFWRQVLAHPTISIWITPMDRKCYKLDVRVLLKFIFWNPNLNVMVFRGETFGRLLGHEGGMLMNRISAFIRRGQRAS